jgi:hypothetical protein
MRRKPFRDLESHMGVDNEEHGASRDAKLPILDTHPSNVQREELVGPIDPIDPIEPVEPIDRPRNVVVAKRRPAWLCDTLHEAEKHGTPHGSFRESRRPQRFLSYMASMSYIIDSEPSIYEEVADQQVWRDAMMEYQSIMKNDVWEIVLRPEGNSVVTSRWIYKIKRATYGNIEKHKARFVARGFS